MFKSIVKTFKWLIYANICYIKSFKTSNKNSPIAAIVDIYYNFDAMNSYQASDDYLLPDNRIDTF